MVNQPMNDIIKVENVSYRYYDRISALAGISLTVQEGERFAVIGSNGSGKSTLLQIMSGLIHPAEGRVFFRGHEVSEAALRNKEFLKFFRGRVGYVFQDSDIQLFCPTVLDELLYGPLQLDMNENEALDRALGVMKLLNMEDLKDRPSYMLSGGEKKRVALGSVLTMNPEVLLLDEPTNGLDPRTQCFLMELLVALNEAGKTIVIATHDLSLVDELHARVAVLSEEHRVENIGSAEDILRDNALLLKVNLIHEHVHYHGEMVHKHLHSHYMVHKHEHEEHSHNHNDPQEATPMNDLAKLKHLLHHWHEHNDEHAQTYKDWADKMLHAGNKELSDVLNKLYQDTKKLSGLFEEAAKLMK
ncbi:MAG: ABC transporter ATP-binding protein [Nitrospirota bacterium]